MSQPVAPPDISPQPEAQPAPQTALVAPPETPATAKAYEPEPLRKQSRVWHAVKWPLR